MSLREGGLGHEIQGRWRRLTPRLCLPPGLGITPHAELGAIIVAQFLCIRRMKEASSGEGGGCKPQQPQAGACASPAVLGWLTGTALLLLPPGGPRLCLYFSAWRSCRPPPCTPGAKHRCLWHGHKAAGSCLPPPEGCGAGGGRACSSRPHLRLLLQSGCGFSICERNHRTALEMLTGTCASMPTEGTEGGGGGVV